MCSQLEAAKSAGMLSLEGSLETFRTHAKFLICIQTLWIGFPPSDKKLENFREVHVNIYIFKGNNSSTQSWRVSNKSVCFQQRGGGGEPWPGASKIFGCVKRRGGGGGGHIGVYKYLRTSNTHILMTKIEPNTPFCK